MIKTLVITSTIREGRTSRKIADWYVVEAKKVAPEGMEFEVLDIADLDLPLFAEAAPPKMHQYSDLQNKIADKISSVDAIVIVTAEYNHSVPGSLKNFLDYIYTEWSHKPVAYVGYGSVGGARAIEHLIQIMTELGAVSVARGSDNIHINSPWSAIDEDGNVNPEFVHGDIQAQLTELNWYAQKLAE